MIERIIRWSLVNRPVVLLATLLLTGWGVYSVRHTPVDAIPDLSDVQVIVRGDFPGQAPQVVEDQVTYPLTSALRAVPGATVVRGYSTFGVAYVYILFSDDTDPALARTRVDEQLNHVREQLPPGARTTLGPESSGVGWIYQYALVDRSGRHDLAELRSLQDWFLRQELQALPGVAEVASVGGMVKQYQVLLDPNRLLYYQATPEGVKESILAANRDTGAASIEMAEGEYPIVSQGALRGLDDLRRTPYLMQWLAGVAPRLSEIADVRIGPQMRRGLAELDGRGEVAGGIIVMRTGANALATCARVKARLAELRSSLPAGVEIVEVYNRSGLIERAVATLWRRLAEEFLLVGAVCALFLFHLRSSLIVIISLPVGILAAFIAMYYQGVTANLMSLGGIAIAIGAMVDAGIVMIENVHKHLERNSGPHSGAVEAALVEVGPPLFFSLLIITASFLPVFALGAQAGRLFAPLAFTKTYSMAAAAVLSITLVPALVALLVRGRIRRETDTPFASRLTALYRPLLLAALHHPRRILLLAAFLMTSAAWPFAKLGTEFMPRFDEGDLLYMPTTLPGLSIGKAQQLLQQTDKLILTVPEVAHVFGKAGSAETATDPAPMTMIETIIHLKARREWRPGMTTQRLIEELDRVVHVPGLTNAWLTPIGAHLDMLATGIKTPVGIKVSGPDLAQISVLTQRIEALLKGLPGTASVNAERLDGAPYIAVDIDREAATRFGISVSQIQELLAMAVGGMDVATINEGRERYTINIRYLPEVRDSLQRLRTLPVIVAGQEPVRLGDVAHLAIRNGPAMIRSENARPSAWVYVTLRDRDLGSWVRSARARVARDIALPAGYSLTWSGQYEYLEHANARLYYIVPAVLVLILLLLYLNFRNLAEPLLVMGAVPLALVGGVWLLYALGYQLSVAVWVGFLALAGVATEFGVVMLVYLRDAVRRRQPRTRESLHAAVVEGAVMRVRPKAMTASVIIAGLLPILLGGGTGAEIMRHIAVPMLGGMITAPLVSMVLIPVLYYLWQARRLPQVGQER